MPARPRRVVKCSCANLKTSAPPPTRQGSRNADLSPYSITEPRRPNQIDALRDTTRHRPSVKRPSRSGCSSACHVYRRVRRDRWVIWMNLFILTPDPAGVWSLLAVSESILKTLATYLRTVLRRQTHSCSQIQIDVPGSPARAPDPCRPMVAVMVGTGCPKSGEIRGSHSRTETRSSCLAAWFGRLKHHPPRCPGWDETTSMSPSRCTRWLQCRQAARAMVLKTR